MSRRGRLASSSAVLAKAAPRSRSGVVVAPVMRSAEHRTCSRWGWLCVSIPLALADQVVDPRRLCAIGWPMRLYQYVMTTLIAAGAAALRTLRASAVAPNTTFCRYWF